MANFWTIYDRIILTAGSASGIGALVQSYRATSPSPQLLVINATGAPMSPTGWAIGWWAVFAVFTGLGLTGFWLRRRKPPQDSGGTVNVTGRALLKGTGKGSVGAKVTAGTLNVGGNAHLEGDAAGLSSEPPKK